MRTLGVTGLGGGRASSLIRVSAADGLGSVDGLRNMPPTNDLSRLLLLLLLADGAEPTA